MKNKQKDLLNSDIALLTIGLINIIFLTVFITLYVSSIGDRERTLILKTYTDYLMTDSQSSQEDRYCVIDEFAIQSSKEEKRLFPMSFEREIINNLCP